MKKKILLLVLVTICCCWANMQQALGQACPAFPCNTCTGGAGGTVSVNASSYCTPCATINISGTAATGIPNQEFVILDNNTLVGDPAASPPTQGPRVVGTLPSSTTSFNLCDINWNFGANPNVSIVRTGYDLAQVTGILESIRTKSVFLLGSCCSIASNLGGVAICPCLPVPVNTTTVPNLQALLTIIDCVGGNTGISLEGLNAVVDGLGGLPGTCRNNIDPACITYSTKATFTIQKPTVTTVTATVGGSSVTNICSGTAFSLSNNALNTCTNSTWQYVYFNAATTDPYTGGTALVANGGTYTLPAQTGCTTQTYFVYTILNPAPAATSVCSQTTVATVCRPTASISIKVYPKPTAPTIVKNNTTCTYSYVAACAGDTFSPTTPTNEAPGYAGGNVSVTVTSGLSGNPCTAETFTNVAKPACAVVCNLTSINLSNNGPKCAGQNVTLTALPQGGTAPYTYTWSNAALSGSTPTVTSGGTYSVTVTDTNGAACSATASTSVTINPLPTITNVVAGCNGGPGTGTLTVTATNAATYAITGSSNTTGMFSNLANNSYTVTVTSAGGCTATATASVSCAVIPVCTLSGAMAMNDGPKCAGSSVGLSSMFSDGQGTISYLWSNQATAASTSATTGGTYTVTITDNIVAGCSATASTSVIINPLPTITNVTAGCTGGPGTGTLTVTATNAATYAITGSSNATGIFSNLANNSYTVTVTSAGGCTATASASVNCVANPTCTLNGAMAMNDGPKCAGSLVGLSSMFSGGQGTISYLWSNQATTANTSTTNGGTYTVIITDNIAAGCSATASTSVTINPLPTITNVTAGCTGGAGTGTLTVTATNAATYAITGSSNATGMFSNLANNSYTVTVTSAGGCTATATASVSCTTSCTPPSVPPLAPVVMNNSCALPNSGSISTVGSAPAGFVLRWYTDLAGTVPAGGSSVAPAYDPVLAVSGSIRFVSTTDPTCVSPPTTFATSPATCGCPNINTFNVGPANACSGSVLSVTAVQSSAGNIVYTWSYTVDGGTSVAIAGNTTSASITTPLNTTCNPKIYRIFVTATCNGNSVTIGGVPVTNFLVHSVNVYPSFLLGSNYTIQTGTCSQDAKVITTCPNFTVSPNSYTPGCNSSGSTIFTVTNSAAPVGCQSTNVSVAYSCSNACSLQACTDPTALNYVAPGPGVITNNALCVYGNCALSVSLSTTSGNNGGVTPFYYNNANLVINSPVNPAVQGPFTFNWANSGYVRYNLDYTSSNTVNVQVTYSDLASWAVTITDANGCVAVVTEDLLGSMLTPPNPNPTLDISNYVISSQSGTTANGAIDISVTGCGAGGGAYSYQWSGPLGFTSTSQDISGLVSGWYSVTVSCGGATTEGWYWVQKKKPGRNKVEELMNQVTAVPNPFTQSTTFNFIVSESGNTTLDVYSLDGKKVANVFSGYVEAGVAQKANFEVNNLPNGIYMATLVTQNGNVINERLVLVK